VKIALIAALIVLTACAGKPVTTDFFNSQADFSAKRELETIVVDAANQQQACAHVTAVLMDLGCELQEINSRLGVISAQPSVRTVHLQFPTYLAHRRQSCGGLRVTATVTGRSNGQQSVRASFIPESPSANQAFGTLLRKSIETEPEEK
jgi:hypothetical protein